MLVSNCSCCQHIPPLDYFPTCPSSHPFHCCQCVPSCHFCQQNKLAFGYCVPSCSTCPVPTTEQDGTTEPDSSETTTRITGTEDIIQFPIPANPSWSNPKLYGWGFQHFVVNVGSTVIVPSVMVSVGGGGNVEKARAIQASLFVMAINTLLQICFGTRLPVSMETSQAYTIPIISIALSTYNNRNNSLDPYQNYEISPFILGRRRDHSIRAFLHVFAGGLEKAAIKRLEQFMRRVQGASLISSIFQMVIGFSGLAKYFARHLSPLASVPLVTLTGLGLYFRGFPLVAKCPQIGLPALAILVFSTQFLPRIWKAKKEIAGQVAIILSVAIVWTYAEILNVAGAYDNTTQETQMNCRTDSSGLIGAAPWIKTPHPFQWGTPIFEAGDALSMMTASLVAVIEGIGTMIDAVFGAGNGSTASVEDAGLLGLTQVGSRRVVIVSAIFMVFLSVLGKVGAFFASIPLPIVGALHTVLFPYVASAGLQYLEFCNVNSFRSMLILGFSLFMGLSVPQYFKEYVFLSGHGPVNTGTTWFNDVMQVIFSSPPTVALIVAFFLDRTHTPGACSTWKDSGRYLKDKSDESEKTKEIYDFITSLGDMCS